MVKSKNTHFWQNSTLTFLSENFKSEAHQSWLVADEEVWRWQVLDSINKLPEKSKILPLCMSNNGDFFMLKFTRNADDEYQTIRYNQRDGKSQVSIVPSGSFRTLLWRNLKIFTKSLVIPYWNSTDVSSWLPYLIGII